MSVILLTVNRACGPEMLWTVVNDTDVGARYYRWIELKLMTKAADSNAV
jgi:hypothetical protein